MTLAINKVNAIIKAAKSVISGAKTRVDAINYLNIKYKIPKNTLRLNIGAYESMSLGNIYTMNISQPVTVMFLEDFKHSNQLHNAILALEKHIEFLELDGSRSPGLKEIKERYSKILNPDGLKDFHKEIADQVAACKSKSIKALEKYLNSKPDVPPLLKAVTTYVYIREPALVAWALKKANGICQSCGSKAPFKKTIDNTPYLEVHHCKPLSEGGFDNMDNVIALCPNCHREMHYGK
jgi:5-methylcytosine-specific restriction protein A